jgi:predicted DNA-binding transcriptional regulator AlpA
MTANTTPLYLPPAATAKRYSIARSQLDKLLTEGRWPRPVKLGRSVRHHIATCDAYMTGEVDAEGRPVKEGAAS